MLERFFKTTNKPDNSAVNDKPRSPRLGRLPHPLFAFDDSKILRHSNAEIDNQDQRSSAIDSTPEPSSSETVQSAQAGDSAETAKSPEPLESSEPAVGNAGLETIFAEIIQDQPRFGFHV